MNILCDLVRQENEYAGIRENLNRSRSAKRRLPSLVTGLCEGAASAFLASLASDCSGGTPALILTGNEKNASKIANSLTEFGLNSAVYPSRDPVLSDMVASRELEQMRISVLRRIRNGSLNAVVAVCDAALEYTIPRAVLDSCELTIRQGEHYSTEELRHFFEKRGYICCDMVDGKGQFSVRGEIVDVFPPQYEKPYRIIFFDDEVEEIVTFDLFTQRRLEKCDRLEITTARELVIGEKEKNEVAEEIRNLMKKAGNRGKEILQTELGILENTNDINFSDKYVSVIYPEPESLMDYFGPEALVCAVETSAIDERLKYHEMRLHELTDELTDQEIPLPKNTSFSKGNEVFYPFLISHGAVLVNNFESHYSGKLEGIYTFKTRVPASYTGNYATFSGDLRMYTLSGMSVLILCENESEARSLEHLITEDGLKALYINNYFDISIIKKGEIVISVLNVSGFDLSNKSFICISLNEKNRVREATYRRKKYDNVSSKEKLMSYADLKTGDLVVHDLHGIGRFLGIESVLDYRKIRSDHIKLQYANGAILYVPCDKIESISKYIGADSEKVNAKLSVIGSTEWTNTKRRVKKEVQDMAKELSLLYAERLRKPGFAFEPDDDLQREFETSFEYVETDGQLKATKEIKEDMEKPCPMDRLLCGDVGFGKTEVALRAAFKAVDNKKQVAILVPTTILALQHYQTIQARMRNFAVEVAMLSRFVTPRQRETTERAIRRGDVDIVVGTHAILSKDVEFKDLGLLIVDEEQRFGVAQKEKLKERFKNVDVLTLSATPIPRTLNMAMSDIRDMSILDEAPVDRLPVQTYVVGFDFATVMGAIRRELQRAGQVFYLHNDIDSIFARANQIQEEFPDAVVRVAHGKMDKEELSDIWRELVEGKIDVLVCTTIIETGVDVPNANTLIIDNAERMGLAQLHQIRGRVGRSSRRAYAYFTFPAGKSLTEDQTKRLQAIRDFTEFGSGFKIALRDLEIRGAGDVLGARQSGHMESVGYDMYVKILNEVMLEEKGETVQVKPECVVKIGRDSYIPVSYISSEAQRIDVYKKISHIRCTADAADILEELSDRYGTVPVEVNSLINASLLRSIGTEYEFTSIEERGLDVIVNMKKIDFIRWSKVSEAYPNTIVLLPSSAPQVLCHNKKKVPPQDFACMLLKKFAEDEN